MAGVIEEFIFPQSLGEEIWATVTYPNANDDVLFIEYSVAGPEFAISKDQAAALFDALKIALGADL